MNKLVKILFTSLLVLPAACSGGDRATPTVEWRADNGCVYDDGVTPANVQTLTLYNLPDSARSIAFNMFARQMHPLDSVDTLVELLPGYYELRSPRIENATPADTVVIRLLARAELRSICYAPDGFHGVSRAGHPFGIEAKMFDILTDSVALTYVPDGAEVYARNAGLASGAAGAYDVVPSFKHIALTEGTSTVDMGTMAFSETPGVKGSERYRVTVADGGISVEADSTRWNALRHRLTHWFGSGAVELPNAVIDDEPSLSYRGVMIDIARNFQPPAEIHRVLDLMAAYGMNVFHFHAVDDEAWRLEISALPELTQVGSRRGYVAAGEERDFLPQLFAGNGNPDATEGTANGYYTRGDIIGIIRHADSLGITVLPEIESPGHARAAIVAMRRRPEYRLDDPADTSRYTSAQALHDNVMNPALPGPYRFMETVVDELVGIYREAGVPLGAVHIGGDEVPANAWGGSPAVQALKDSLGLADDKAVHAYFVDRIAEMLASKGLKMSGWQEVALGHPDAYNRRVQPVTNSVNCWQTLGARGARVVADIVSAGFPAVLSNVQHFYLDMCYSPHPLERGLSWGGYVDEFDALHGYPARLASEMRPVGVSCQVFAETIRSEAGLEEMLLPKMLGVAERAWNPDSTYSDAGFNAVIAGRMPVWQSEGLSFHVRQPGLVSDGESVTANSSYPGASIALTFINANGSSCAATVRPGVPTFVPDGTRQIRATQTVAGRTSVPSVLNFAD